MWRFIKGFLRVVLKPLSFVPAILVMSMIFRFSAQTGEQSSQISLEVSYKAVTIADRYLNIGLTEEQVDHLVERLHFYIRKLGHVTEYFILAVTVAFPLYVYRIRGWKLMLLASVLCIGYAALDEYHQSFVSGRGPSVRDVCIDSIGVFAGIILTRIVGWTGRMTIFRPLSNRREQDDRE